MHIFVTGASGYIGGAVARYLVQAGHTVTALARTDASAAHLAAEGLRVHRGSLEDAAGLRAAIEPVDAVIHNAVGIPRGVTGTDVEAVDAMVEALAGRDAPLLLTSGLGVYAGCQTAVADEETVLDTVIPAQAPRVQLEDRVRRAAAQRLRTVVLRPGHVYGRGHAGAFTRIQMDHAAREGVGGYVSPGTVPYATIHIDDLCSLYLAALERAPAGSLYNAVGNTLTTRELAGAMSHSVGGKGLTRALTPDEAREIWGPLAGLLISAPAVLGLKAVADLGWTPRSPTLPYELIHGSMRRDRGGA